MNNTAICIQLFIFLILICDVCHAERRIGNLEQKIREGALPKWCLATEEGGITSPLFKKYKKKYGKSWSAMHHYCYCLDATNLANKRKLENNEKLYLYNLRKAKTEAEFVIPRVTDDFVLKPVILTNYGKILIQLNELVQANKSFSAAIRLKPDYPLPYLYLSQLYSQRDMKERAIKVLKKGISKCQDNGLLRKELSRLQGN